LSDPSVNFQENYAGMSDDELLMTASSRADLVPEAAHALDSEMARRRLGYEEAHAKKREVTRLEIQEARRYRPSRKASKYFVARANGGRPLLLALGVPLLLSVLLFTHVIPEEWFFPILSVCIGAVVALMVVQPWLRRSSSFWIALVVSCAVQLFVGYWLNVHLAPQTRGEVKGVGVLTIVPGYVSGLLTFLLLQKLDRRKAPQPDSY
jgi:hypothetical protein